MKCVRSAIVLTSAILVASTSFADVAWTGAGTDRNWDNPANWVELVDGSPTGPNRIPETGDYAYINGPYASGSNIPLIADGMEAICKVLVTEAGTCTIEMTGGNLELSGWGSWLGDGTGNIATFEMKGGTVDYTGSPGILECGWQPSDSPPGSCQGIWNMTGGVVNAKGVSLPGGGGGIGEIHLEGGQLNVGTARGGLVFDDDWPDSASFDITEGVLVLEGQQSLKVEGYWGDGRLTAYGGAGSLMYNYDSVNDTTTVTASMTVTSDLGGDGYFGSADLDIVRAAWGNSVTPGCLPCGDANGDGVVNSGDLDIVRANWGNTVLYSPAAVPEPSTFVLLIFSLAGFTLRRR